jgi:hypothetical protein
MKFWFSDLVVMLGEGLLSLSSSTGSNNKERERSLARQVELVGVGLIGQKIHVENLKLPFPSRNLDVDCGW